MRLRQFVFALLVLLPGLAGFLPAQAGAPVSLDDYWKLVAHTQEVVASLEDSPAAASRPPLADLAAQWAGITQVTLADGSLVNVDHSYLLALLRADGPNLKLIDGLLAALLAARESYPRGIFTAADLQALTAILARPEFQWKVKEPSPWQQWWDQLWQRFWGWLENLLGNKAFRAISPLASYLLTGVGALALLLVLVYIFRKLFSDFVAEAEIDPDGEAGDQLLTSEAALKRAQSLSGAGDYRTAVRYLYLSSLLLLEERGLLRYDRSKTNRETLRSVANLPQLSGPLQEVVEVFDRVWYGYQPLDETSYARYRAQVEELREQKP